MLVQEKKNNINVLHIVREFLAYGKMTILCKIIASKWKI